MRRLLFIIVLLILTSLACGVSTPTAAPAQPTAPLPPTNTAPRTHYRSPAGAHPGSYRAGGQRAYC